MDELGKFAIGCFLGYFVGKWFGQYQDETGFLVSDGGNT